MWVLIVLLAANACAAIAYMISNRKCESRSWATGLFFILVPWFGFLFHFLASRFDTHQHVVTDTEDPFAGPGSTETERSRDLQQLRKNLQENYRFLLLAERDKDTGAVPYYSASAKEEAYRADEALWNQRRQAFDKAPDDAAAFHAACSALLKLMDSDMLSDSDLARHRATLVRLVQNELQRHPDAVTPVEYEECLRALIADGSYDEAEKLWKKATPRLRTETSYQDMLAMYYKLRDRQMFQGVLEDLRNNERIRISSTGREQLKYWSKRLTNAA